MSNAALETIVLEQQGHRWFAAVEEGTKCTVLVYLSVKNRSYFCQYFTSENILLSLTFPAVYLLNKDLCE